MDRVLKIINILLLSIVGMLLLTGVMVLVQGNKVDFKAADLWAALSAVATVGTFVVALIALRKAPDWLGQKKHEDGYNIAKNLFLNDFFELNKTVLHSCSLAEILYFEIDQISDDVDFILTVDMCTENLSIFRHSQSTPVSMKANLERLKILGWHFNEGSKKRFVDMITLFSIIQRNHNALWSYMKYLIGKEQRRSNAEIKAYIINISKKMNMLQEKFEKEYDELFKYDFEDNFDIVKTKCKKKL